MWNVLNSMVSILPIPYEYKIFCEILANRMWNLRTFCLTLAFKTLIDSVFILISSIVSLCVFAINQSVDINFFEVSFGILNSFVSISFCLHGFLCILNKNTEKIRFFYVYVLYSTAVAFFLNYKYAAGGGLCHEIKSVFSGWDVVPLLYEVLESIPTWVCHPVTSFIFGAWSVIQQASMALTLDAYLEELESEKDRERFFLDAKNAARKGMANPLQTAVLRQYASFETCEELGNVIDFPQERGIVNTQLYSESSSETDDSWAMPAPNYGACTSPPPRKDLLQTSHNIYTPSSQLTES
eukprot:GDKK01033142.1.p1 GENE.GDKK01033142.1~~GDKK01033142.1.p1  ORF type:complete len:297 (+),score=44.97 GDKK01033142.1:43-933(+)